jgi:hypothetical protein
MCIPSRLAAFVGWVERQRNPSYALTKLIGLKESLYLWIGFEFKIAELVRHRARPQGSHGRKQKKPERGPKFAGHGLESLPEFWHVR